MSIDLDDLPTMEDMCFGDYCEECKEYNAGGMCPCGIGADDD